MTSNCLLNPDVGQYADRLFTRSIVGWPSVKYIDGDYFSQVIDCIIALEGFKHNEIEQGHILACSSTIIANAEVSFT